MLSAVPTSWLSSTTTFWVELLDGVLLVAPLASTVPPLNRGPVASPQVSPPAELELPKATSVPPLMFSVPLDSSASPLALT